jgi:hypothetical protein
MRNVETPGAEAGVQLGLLPLGQGVAQAAEHLSSKMCDARPQVKCTRHAPCLTSLMMSRGSLAQEQLELLALHGSAQAACVSCPLTPRSHPTSHGSPKLHGARP